MSSIPTDFPSTVCTPVTTSPEAAVSEAPAVRGTQRSGDDQGRSIWARTPAACVERRGRA